MSWLDWKLKDKGKEEVVGTASQTKFKHSFNGEGDGENHIINIEYSNGKKVTLKIHGEWEFNEFKEFVSSLKLNKIG